MKTLVILLMAAAVLALGLPVANHYERSVVFRLGRYQATRGPGLYWQLSLIEWEATADLRVVRIATAGTLGV